MNEGLLTSIGHLIPAVRSLAIVDSDLYAGTNGAGVWRRPLSQMVTSAEGLSSERPSTYALWQNYPNPFNPTTVISYQLPAVSDVRLVVYDILGREVSVLVNERQNPGRYELRFDARLSGGQASGLSSGVYFYRLQAGDFAQTKRLMVLK